VAAVQLIRLWSADGEHSPRRGGDQPLRRFFSAPAAESLPASLAAIWILSFNVPF
jgi:hypothetical protein